MGNLLLAADYFDAAEPFYLHAQSLAPDDMRWPYYLGTCTWPGPDLRRPSHPSSARSACDRTTWPRWCGLEACISIRGSPSLAEQRSRRRCPSACDGVGALRPWSGGAGEARVPHRPSIGSNRRCQPIRGRQSRTIRSRWPIGRLGDTAKAEAHFGSGASVEVGPPDPLMVGAARADSRAG